MYHGQIDSTKSKLNLSYINNVQIRNPASNTTSTYAENSYMPFFILNKTVSFTVDLSKVSCACVFALYFTSLPAKAYCGSDPTSSGSYYCDASGYGGSYCPEMDLMEANAYGFTSAAHDCALNQNPSSTNYQKYSSCSQVASNLFTYKNVTNASLTGQAVYGPGKYINTSAEFKVAVKFQTTSGSLTSITNTISQGTNVISYTWLNSTISSPSFMSSFSTKLAGGMGLMFSLWGSSTGPLGWLDNNIGTCNTNGTACNHSITSGVISNVKIA